jgi:hypothetical protein
VLAKGSFHSVEIDPRAPNLDLPVLASAPLQPSVRPLANQIYRAEYPAGGSPATFNAGFDAAREAMSIDPNSQPRTGDDQLADAGRRIVPIFVNLVSYSRHSE